jgi:protein-tyrosine phosphatase
VSLLSLGLSRTSTGAVSEIIANNNYSVAEVLAWLQKQEWGKIDLPNLVKREIKKVLESTRWGNAARKS